MKRTLSWLWAVLSSRALSPVVLGFFFLLYVGIAFFSEETLTMLIMLTKSSLPVAAVLGLIPLNCACRLLNEARIHLKRRRALTRGVEGEAALCYDEAVEVPTSRTPSELQARLAAEGYRTRVSEGRLAAWRGIAISPARLLFLAGAFLLFAGIVISVTSRAVYRQSLIEGVQFQAPSGAAGQITRILFRNTDGAILSKELQIANLEPGGGTGQFGIYPPALFGGAFVYPRYLGVALDYRLTAPDLPKGYENNGVFPLYPPGKEANLTVGDTPYKVNLSLLKPEDGSDPYMTGRFVFLCKLLKGSDLLFEGTVPGGGEFAKDGIRLAIPDARRMVITDFVVDYGVLMIWWAGVFLLLALLYWLPVRCFFPRREMVFGFGTNGVRGYSHQEGRGRAHAGVFHEALDFLAGQQQVSRHLSED